MIPDQEGRRRRLLQHHCTSKEGKKRRRKKTFLRKIAKKIHRQKKEFQTGGFTVVSFRR